MAPGRRGRPPHPDVLTPAEWRVVQAVRHGMSNRIIAARLGVSVDAVKFHVQNAVEKLGVSGRRGLRRWQGAPMESAIHTTPDTESHLHTMEVPMPDPQESPSTPGPTRRSLGPIGQVARAVKDIAKAEAWYRDVLGLPHLYTFGQLAFFDCDGLRLMLEEESIVNVPELHNDSVLYFRVADIHAAQTELESRGVAFEGAPHMIFKHDDGTEEWMTFFKDPDGRLLSLMSQVRS